MISLVALLVAGQVALDQTPLDTEPVIDVREVQDCLTTDGLRVERGVWMSNRSAMFKADAQLRRDRELATLRGRPSWTTVAVLVVGGLIVGGAVGYVGARLLAPPQQP